MNYFEKCVSAFRASGVQEVSEYENCNMLQANNDLVTRHTTTPALLRENSARIVEKSVYYISDLHLAHHIVHHFPNGATDEQIKDYIHDIVLALYSGDLFDDLKAFRSPIVLFGGDVSSVFSVAELFYREFITQWELSLDTQHEYYLQLFTPLTTELATIKEEIDIWRDSHPWSLKAQRALHEYSDKKVPKRIKELLSRSDHLELEIGKLEEQLNLGISWERDYRKVRSQKAVYCILGNHEFWDFDTFDACEQAYSSLFASLGMRFLNDTIGWLGIKEAPLVTRRNPETGELYGKLLTKENDPDEYEYLLLLFNNIIIVGGLGYAPLNQSFNAIQGIYGQAIDRAEEILRSDSFRQAFKSALCASREHHCTLVVLSHMPVSDWYDGSEDISNCVFFTGHTHRNETICTENNAFIYADNQVGYTSQKYCFKKAALYPPRDPFASDPDGYREISCTEYKEFYRFMCEPLPKTGTIERQMKLYEGKMFVLKKDGYYAFFFSSPKGVYICNGGQLLKIGKPGSLSLYFDSLSAMVNHYVTEYSPLRRFQEKLSAYIKSFGGTGKIHGTIVDINFSNHIMIDLEHKALSFYNSPVFGLVKSYPDLGSLLHAHCLELEGNYLALGNAQLSTLSQQAFTEYHSDYEAVNIKNSPYVLSRKINPIHRLFEKRILRAWDPDFEPLTVYIDHS